MRHHPLVSGMDFFEYGFSFLVKKNSDFVVVEE